MIAAWVVLLGFCFGATIASGTVAFVISLGIIPRYAGITRTANNLLFYETAAVLGVLFGDLLTVFGMDVPVGKVGIALFGCFSGIFLGSWIVALGEVLDIYAIMVRRLKLRKGITGMVISMVLGKVAGAFWFFWKGW